MWLTTVFIFYALASCANADETVFEDKPPPPPEASQASQSTSNSVDANYQLIAKLDALTATTNRIDINIQRLQERAHLWAVLRHHIDAWNDQMKAQEAKMQLLQRSNVDEREKLTELEALLQRMLRKLVTSQVVPLAPHPAPSGDDMATLMASRLSDIQRQLQNIEATQSQQQQQQAQRNCNCKTTTATTTTATKEQLPAAKEFKQLQALAKRNGKMLERLLQVVNDSEAQGRCLVAAGDLQQRIDGIAGELATFTGSADVLLKRIEASIKTQANAAEAGGQESSVEATESNELQEEEEDVAVEEEDNEREAHDHTDVADTALKEHIENADSAENETEQQAGPTGCHDLNAAEQAAGVYQFGTPQLNAAGRDFKQRYCTFVATQEVEIEPGIDTSQLSSWTVLLNREPAPNDGIQENFNRSWAEYRDGFGDLTAEFWWGNENIHRLSDSDDPYELRVEVVDFEGVSAWAQWRSFRVASELHNYMLLLDGFAGNLSNALQYHNELEFSTYDRRNDHSVDACCPCAITFGSGWWFANCFQANLNGVYQTVKPLANNHVALLWDDIPLQRARLLVRPISAAAADGVREDP